MHHQKTAFQNWVLQLKWSAFFRKQMKFIVFFFAFKKIILVQV